MIQYSQFDSVIGKITLSAIPEGICHIALPGDNLTNSFNWCKKNLHSNEFVRSSEWTAQAELEIQQFLSGKLQRFSFSTFHINTQFRKKVLEEVAKIPYGNTASYSDIAHRINKPKASRAVGTANATNPLPLVIPCHRVISKNGSLGGFGGGLKMKQLLLNLELQNS
ncbi:MAG: methylated-DNA--[protein]-cysteine S-methyltransferase [Candidatus Marinimicrobia bacterium]|nr:methylated-DNA--[protein]-cysteine S-methyltransferase [Candidatus Neomarinimicrobiota bacterium]MBL7023173.1 methylated-DNA--[protein]-cysteine S-methyltransferase [Candidatus Neomarinimicrobiota bacterium]MBL7109019.1 methylated-DNA--[protein]-cysteine S-methyltransferase [Candidatus Neomarinimicrobiota bacterium]